MELRSCFLGDRNVIGRIGERPHCQSYRSLTDGRLTWLSIEVLKSSSLNLFLATFELTKSVSANSGGDQFRGHWTWSEGL